MVFKNSDECKRTYEEYLMDQILLLYLINETDKRGFISDILKLVKLIFISELQSLKKNIKGFSYRMYKWEMGPYDDEIQTDIEKLIQNNLLKIINNKPGIFLTKEGEDVLEKFKDDIPKFLTNNIDWTAKTFGKINSFVLKSMTHNFKISLNGKIIKIDDLPNDRNLCIFKDYFSKAPKELHFSEDLLDDFEFLTNPQNKIRIEKIKTTLTGDTHGKRFVPI